ncbi:MAG: hypothetical protein JSU86_03265, partial [Phycisphaerales bacterium]
MKCKQCGQQTGGFTVGDSVVLPLCPACLSEIQRTLGEAAGALNDLRQVLADLDVSADDVERVSEALVRTPERSQAWENLPAGDRLFVNAMAHVIQLFGERPGLRFVDLPEALLASIKRCSRAALFSTMGECLRLTLGDFNKLLHVMEIFDYEHFDYEDPPEPLGSFVEQASGDELLSLLYESLDVLMGTNGL